MGITRHLSEGARSAAPASHRMLAWAAAAMLCTALLPSSSMARLDGNARRAQDGTAYYILQHRNIDDAGIGVDGSTITTITA